MTGKHPIMGKLCPNCGQPNRTRPPYHKKHSFQDAHVPAGQLKFSYVHVDDCAAAYLAALQHGKAGNIYHIGAPEPITTSQLAKAIAARLSSTEQEIPVKQVSKDDAASLFSNPIFIFFLSISSWMDTSKAQRELKWHAKSRKDLATAIVEAE